MSDIVSLLDPDDQTLPFAEATIHNGTVYISGFVGYSRETQRVVPGGLEEQTRQTLALIDEVLERAGASRERLTRMRIYLAHAQRDFAAFNQIFREWIGDHRPARTTVGVEMAEAGLLIEIDAQAVLPNSTK